jgi:hypothetical protein
MSASARPTKITFADIYDYLQGLRQAVRLCWFFIPDDLSAFATKKPND